MAMIDDFRTLAPTTIRGTDSNSLLRLYDQAKEAMNQTSVQLIRSRVGKTVERIAAELRRRNVSL